MSSKKMKNNYIETVSLYPPPDLQNGFKRLCFASATQISSNLQICNRQYQTIMASMKCANSYTDFSRTH